LHNLPLELTTEATRPSRTPGIGELAVASRGRWIQFVGILTNSVLTWAWPSASAPLYFAMPQMAW